MALTNAEKQRAWRARHVDRRHRVALIDSMLMWRQLASGQTFKIQLGWNWVTIDANFFYLASLICGVLETDKAINQLRWSLTKCVRDRQLARREAGSRAVRRGPAEEAFLEWHRRYSVRRFV
jgi:hypothetical protein